jgi:hypothetical protein
MKVKIPFLGKKNNFAGYRRAPKTKITTAEDAY